jgi:hypothetical protein
MNARRLFYWPEEGCDPNLLEIVAPRLNRLFHFKGDVEAGTRVVHVILRGLEFRHTTYTLGHLEARVNTDAAVVLENALHCRIEQCRFENIGGYGVRRDFSRYHCDRRTNAVLSLPRFRCRAYRGGRDDREFGVQRETSPRCVRGRAANRSARARRAIRGRRAVRRGRGRTAAGFEPERTDLGSRATAQACDQMNLAPPSARRCPFFQCLL